MTLPNTKEGLVLVLQKHVMKQTKKSQTLQKWETFSIDIFQKSAPNWIFK